MGFLLLLSAGVVATCGLVYELLAGTLASYLLGDSVTQFSTIIGTYLFAMGIGSWLSRWVQDRLLETFIRVEILVGLFGGFSAGLMFVLFARVSSFRAVLYGLVLIIGVLVGLEIPLLLRILKEKFEFSDLVARVLTFDYIGALAASLVFPLLCVPYLGLVRTGFLFGILNVGVALLLLWKLPPQSGFAGLRAFGLIALGLLLGGFVLAEQITRFGEDAEYPGSIVYTATTPYQRLVLTRESDDLRLFINGNLQFSSRDEYRYHEALVHPALSRVQDLRNVLILGGGDGLAVREVLRYPSIRHVTLVDLDPAMTQLFSQSEPLRRLNDHSLSSPLLKIINADAFMWLRGNGELFDAIIVDFPDPGNFSLGKLYSVTFYRELQRALAPAGVAVVQSTSPFFARKAYWCIERTLAAAGLVTRPYHVVVPSFGEWGYVLAAHGTMPPLGTLPLGLRFANSTTLATTFQFAPDIGPIPVEVNRLDNQVLVRYFDEEWSHYTAIN